MNIKIKISDIVSTNNFKIFLKEGDSPYPINDNDYVLYNQYSSGTEHVLINNVLFKKNTKYWVKLMDVKTGRYIIENINTFSLLPTPTPTQTTILQVTPTQTSTPTVTPTQTSTPTVTPTQTSTPTVTPTQTSTPTPTPTQPLFWYVLYRCDDGETYHVGPYTGAFQHQTGDRVEGATQTYYVITSMTYTEPSTTITGITGTGEQGCPENPTPPLTVFQNQIYRYSDETNIETMCGKLPYQFPSYNLIGETVYSHSQLVSGISTDLYSDDLLNTPFDPGGQHQWGVMINNQIVSDIAWVIGNTIQDWVVCNT